MEMEVPIASTGAQANPEQTVEELLAQIPTLTNTKLVKEIGLAHEKATAYQQQSWERETDGKFHRR